MTSKYFKKYDIVDKEFDEIIDGNNNLGGMLQGYIAEYKLRQMFFINHSNIDSCIKIQDQDTSIKADFKVCYNNTIITVESKSLDAKSVKKKRNIFTKKGFEWKARVSCNTYYKRKLLLPNEDTVEVALFQYGEFDMLAVNLFLLENKWQFAFAKSSELPYSKSKQYGDNGRYLISSSIPIVWPDLNFPWRTEPYSIMEELIKERKDV